MLLLASLASLTPLASGGAASLAQLAALSEAVSPGLASDMARALDLVDRSAVACASAPCGRACFLVAPPRERVLAPVTADFCPCAVFGELLASGSGRRACAHILAVHAALAVGAVVQRVLSSDEDLAALLLSADR